MSSHFSRVAAAALIAGTALIPAHASLVFLGTTDQQGAGLGNVSTVLTLQSPGNSSTETASVGREIGNLSDVTTGDAKLGASQTLTRTLGELDVASAADLRIIFNASEPGNIDGRSITLNDLVLNIFSTDGALLFNSGAFTSVSFPETFSGTGTSGFVFGLDAEQAASAQALGFGDLSNRIGLSATATNATGGLETFSIGNVAATVPVPVPVPVPEPSTLALALLGGLALVGRFGRRRS